MKMMLFRSCVLKAVLATFVLVASTFARDARIVKLIGSGSAFVETPGVARQPAAVGMVVSQNATITTAGMEVLVETAPGAVAGIKPGSSVTLASLATRGAVEDTELFLNQGSVVSTIDPGKARVNDYKVRTQRGVAAAKATVYTVSVTQTAMSVATLSGTIVLTPVTPGAPTITINLGTGTVLTDAPGAAAVPLSQIAQANPQIAEAIAGAVTTVSTAIQSNVVSGLSADAATTVLTSVVSAASQALPQQAATFTQQAVNAATSPGSAVSSGNANAVSAISEAAAQGATQTLTQQGNSGAAQQVNQQIAQTASTTASSNNVSVNNQDIVNAVQSGANTGATRTGAPPPPPPSLPGTTPPTTPSSSTVVAPTTTPPISTDARNTSPSN